MDLAKDLTVALSISAAVFVVVGVPIGVGGYYWAKESCEARWEGTHDTRFGLFEGCRVYVDGRWMPEGIYRQTRDQWERE